MSTTGREITSSDHSEAGRGVRIKPELRPIDLPVREFLKAGARRGLTTDQMFPDDVSGAPDAPASGA